MRTVYLVAELPPGEVSRAVRLPDGTIVRVCARAIFDRAVRAAMKPNS